MTAFNLKVGRNGFVLTMAVMGGRSDHASVMDEQPWGRVAAILRDHGVTLAEVIREDARSRADGDPEYITAEVENG